MINILLTSAGRRVELVQQFVNEKRKLGIDGKIICADMNELAPALYFGDCHYIVPPIKDINYIPTLIDICKKEKIKLLIPTIDTELNILASNVDKFYDVDTEVLVSNKEVISMTYDKLKTYELFKNIGVKTPKSYCKGEKYTGEFPCFIKPVSGSSSINAFKVNNKKELDFFSWYINNYIIQEFIEGEEFTIDIFCDFNGNPIYITPRIRIATRSGEVAKTKIVYNKKLINEVIKIIDYLKPKGAITIQAIKSKDNGKFYFIEINARFGGGSPLTMMAGANSVQALYRILRGEKLKYAPMVAKEDLLLIRFDQCIMLNMNSNGKYEKI